jgi:small GTP-binding protein
MEEVSKIKIILLGDSEVGKTSILCKFSNPEFDLTKHDSEATTGYEFISLKEKYMGQEVQVDIWDTIGQDRFDSIATNYYRSSSGAVLVYDISSRNSFEGRPFINSQ